MSGHPSSTQACDRVNAEIKLQYIQLIRYQLIFAYTAEEREKKR